MKRERTRHAAITVEYLLLVLLVIGVGASMIGLQDNVKNYVNATGNSVQELSSSSSSDSSNSTTGSLLVTDTTGGESDNTSSVEQRLLAISNLQAYTWDELKYIADDLSENGTNSVYYTHMLGIIQADGNKEFSTSSDTVGTTVKVRIIGVCQDVKEDGTIAGLTFQTTHMLATTHQMNTSKTNSGGWGETNMREWLNNTVYDSLPDDLKDNIASVKKYYGSDSKSVTSDTVCSNDKLFLLSMREVYNYSGDGQWPWYIYEGTGAGHDEQYQYYECNGVSMSSYYFLDNTGYDYDGNKPSVFWWLRSVHQNSNSVFYPVRGCAGYADPDDNYANYAMGVMPAFAF